MSNGVSGGENSGLDISSVGMYSGVLMISSLFSSFSFSLSAMTSLALLLFFLDPDVDWLVFLFPEGC